MMNNPRTASLFLIFLIACLPQDIFGQREITNRRTAAHQQVNGTRFYLVPPANFVASTGFQGFQEPETGSSIMVMEIPGPFAESTRGFTEEGLKPQGVNLQKKEEIKVNGKEGLFLIADQVADQTTFLKYILVFGDEKLTCMVNGTFPRAVSLHHKEIIESILSVYHDQSATVDPLAGIAFSLDVTGTKLIPAHTLSGTVMYTVDGKVPPQTTDRTMLMVGPSTGVVVGSDRRKTAMERMRKLPYTDLKVDEKAVAQVTIDGLTGWEISGEGTSTSGIKEAIYQVMLFTDSEYYIMLGVTNEDFQANLELLRRIVRTFKLKR